MKIYSNEKLIKRNRRLGNITSLGSIGILGMGMVLSFSDKTGAKLPYTFGALIVGFLLFQVGNFYMSKWGKSPRPDEKLSAALKGLDNNYSLYHYMTPISHLLVGPSGILCLLAYQQAGLITYDKARNKWLQSGGSFFMKAFGGESLGHPEREATYVAADAEKFFAKSEIDLGSYKPESILVFTNEKAELNAEDSGVPAIAGAKLKEYIRKRAKTTNLPVRIAEIIENKYSV